MRKILCCVLLVAIAGCNSLKNGPHESFDALSEVHAGDARILAERTADELQQRYSPGSTAVMLHRVPGVFGEALEQDLRSAGFAMNENGVGIRYKVDIRQDGDAPMQGYVQVSCSDGKLFNFSQPLGQPARITEPPAARPVPEDHPLESHVLPESPAPLKQKDTASTQAVPDRTTAKARAVAKRNGVDVASFCKWNGVKPSTVLHKGREVYLSQPPVPPQISSKAATSAPAKPIVHSAAPATPTAPFMAPAAATLPPPVLIDSPQHTQEQQWAISRGQMLRIQMEAWASAGGYSLVWNAINDYEMKSSATFKGSFIDAIRSLFAALQSNGLALRVTIYQGNNVIEISEH